MSDWAREREDADWAVQEERERSPERGDGAYNFANCTGFLDFYEMHTRDHQAGVPEVVQALCRDLLEKDAETPRDTVFEVKTFPKTCERLLMKDPSGVNRLIGELVVPSAETARDRGLTEFDHYSVSMGDVWKWMLPLIENEREEMRRPQPDYAVGFLADAFTEEQLRKMEPYSGIESYFRCTASMYFPFLTTEIATSKPLDMADVENTYSAGLGAGGVVGLFREAKREEELHEQVVAFSISHSHCAVRIYAHYVMVDDGKVSYYRHLVREYELTPADIEDRWTSYKFALALYSNWAPEYHRRLCSAIDDLPDPPELDTPN
ncbi:hypothetical protein BJY01DRAFT_231686 [Aspergillus pseudoustus]|uniref:DUF7924 domain-containing protein n=1 Tax=Aspergillus pseudoustus TaxID=1810923 RepID=A0ABR4KSW7_9EURO